MFFLISHSRSSESLGDPSLRRHSPKTPNSGTSRQTSATSKNILRSWGKNGAIQQGKRFYLQVFKTLAITIKYFLISLLFTHIKWQCHVFMFMEHIPAKFGPEGWSFYGVEGWMEWTANMYVFVGSELNTRWLILFWSAEVHLTDYSCDRFQYPSWIKL